MYMLVCCWSSTLFLISLDQLHLVFLWKLKLTWTWSLNLSSEPFLGPISHRFYFKTKRLIWKILILPESFFFWIQLKLVLIYSIFYLFIFALLLALPSSCILYNNKKLGVIFLNSLFLYVRHFITLYILYSDA